MKKITVRELFCLYKINTSQKSSGYKWEVNTKQKEVVCFYQSLEKHSLEEPINNYSLGTIKLYNLPSKEMSDGEQRLTTTIIFVASLFNKLRTIRELNLSEIEIYEDIIKRNGSYKFSTINQDNQLFKDCVIDKIPLKKDLQISKSGERILSALHYFENKLIHKSEVEVVNLLNSVINAKCILELINNFEFTYSRFEYNQLFYLLKAEDISESLAYMVDFKEHRCLKIIPNEFSIEASNKDITIIILLYVGFETEEYQSLKTRKNVHIISFDKIVLDMVEFKKIPIKIIPTLAFAQTVIERAKSLEIYDLKTLMNLKL